MRIKSSILKSNAIRDAVNSVIIMQDRKTEWERAIRDWKYYASSHGEQFRESKRIIKSP